MEESAQKKLSVFFENYPQKRYKKGDILISPGTVPAGIYYLIRGAVKQYSISESGHEQILNFFRPHSFFPMMWAIGEVPNNHYFEVDSVVTLYVAPQKEFIAFIKKEPAILYDLLQRIYRGLSGLFARVEYLMYGSAYHAVIFTIINMAHRLRDINKLNNDIILRISHKDIAAFSGLTKETISRQSRKLQERGLIENKHHEIHILNLKNLEKELI